MKAMLVQPIQAGRRAWLLLRPGDICYTSVDHHCVDYADCAGCAQTECGSNSIAPQPSHFRGRARAEARRFEQRLAGSKRAAPALGRPGLRRREESRIGIHWRQ